MSDFKGWSDAHAARELELYSENTGELYDSYKRNVDVMKALIERAEYDERGDIARIWLPWLNVAAKRYVREIARGENDRLLFPVHVRLAVAKRIADHEYGRILRGEWGPLHRAALKGLNEAASNPLARRGYFRRSSLNRDLERYYGQCLKSPKAHRFGRGRAENYCSRVAWAVARKSDRYRDYPAFKNPMVIKGCFPNPINYHDLNRVARVAQHWWDGQNDPLYKLGSSVFAGRDVSRVVAEEALHELEKLRRYQDGRNAKRELGEAIADLRAALASTARENPMSERQKTGAVLVALSVSSLIGLLIIKATNSAAPPPPSPTPTPTTVL